MGKRDHKQRKKKERQERLRREKHLRQYRPGVPGDEDDLDGPEDYDLELPPPTATERMLRGLAGGSSLLGKLRGS